MKKRIYSEEEFRQKFSQEQLAKIYCKMNGWKTPDAFGLSKPLSRDEVRENMRNLGGLVPKAEWIVVWREHGSKVLI